MELEPPVPILAQQGGFPLTAYVTFDQFLVPGPLNAANWTVRISNNTYSFTSVTAVGAIVVLVCNVPSVSPGPDGVSYTATPADVVALATGSPAAAFANYPFT